jgi:hypothetical protein
MDLLPRVQLDEEEMLLFTYLNPVIAYLLKKCQFETVLLKLYSGYSAMYIHLMSRVSSLYAFDLYRVCVQR